MLAAPQPEATTPPGPMPTSTKHRRRNQRKRTLYLAMLRPVAGLTPNARLVLGVLRKLRHRQVSRSELRAEARLADSSIGDALESLRRGGFLAYYGRDRYGLSPAGEALYEGDGQVGYHLVPIRVIQQLGRHAAAVLDTVYALASLDWRRSLRYRRPRIALRALAQRLSRAPDTVGVHLRRAMRAGLIERLSRRVWECSTYRLLPVLDPHHNDAVAAPVQSRSSVSVGSSDSETMAAAERALAQVMRRPIPIPG